MINANALFPGQRADEKILLVLRRHWIVMVLDLLGSVGALLLYGLLVWVITIGFPGLISEFPQEFGAITMLAILSIVLRTYVAWVDYSLDAFILTDERLVEISQNALFNRQISELRLADIEDVSAKVVGVLGTFLKYGTIFIQTAAATDVFEFLRVPNPYEVVRVLAEAKAAREKATFTVS